MYMFQHTGRLLRKQKYLCYEHLVSIYKHFKQHLHVCYENEQLVSKETKSKYAGKRHTAMDCSFFHLKQQNITTSYHLILFQISLIYIISVSH